MYMLNVVVIDVCKNKINNYKKKQTKKLCALEYHLFYYCVSSCMDWVVWWIPGEQYRLSWGIRFFCIYEL